MMTEVKDFLGNLIEIDDYFAYPLTVGRSATQAIYQFKGITPSGSYRARPVKRSSESHQDYQIWDSNIRKYRDMTVEERAKVDSKTSILHYLNRRAVKLANFKDGE
jgi:hypothetical protein